MFYDYTPALWDPPTIAQMKPAGNLPFLFGVVIYAYEGIGMILPIEAAMKHKEKFPSVMYGVTGLVTAIYVCLGAVSHTHALQPQPDRTSTPNMFQRLLTYTNDLACKRKCLVSQSERPNLPSLI